MPVKLELNNISQKTNPYKNLNFTGNDQPFAQFTQTAPAATVQTTNAAPVYTPPSPAPSLAPQPNSDAYTVAPQISEPAVTAVPEESPNNKKKAIDSILKYSGIVALAAIPVVSVILGKSIKGNNSKFTGEIAKLGDKINQNKDEVLEALRQQTEKSVTIESVKKVVDESSSSLAAEITKLAAAVGTGALATRIFTVRKKDGAEGSEHSGSIKNRRASKVDITEDLIRLLEAESKKRIEGQYKWPKIENIKGWMVTAETENFMKVGGLADVATQLPEAFGAKFKDNPDNKLTIVTPAYVSTTGGRLNKFEEIDGVLTYVSRDNKGKVNGSMPVEKAGEIEVEVFSQKTKRFQKEKVEIMKGQLNGAEYILLKNDKYFNFDPSASNNPECKDAYATNVNDIDEVERFAFMSKASYVLMNELQQGKMNDKLEKPNVVVANDWHASSMSALMRYMAPLQEANKEITPEAKTYIDQTPIIHITHNNALQGKNSKNADEIFRTLFGQYTDVITKNIKGYVDSIYPMSNGFGTINSAYIDLHLADKIVPVSTNYGDELTKSSEFGGEVKPIFDRRKEKSTLTPIINGFDKRKAEFNQGRADSTSKLLDLTGDAAFKPYGASEEGYQIKQDNKVKFAQGMQDIVEKFKKGEKPIGGVNQLCKAEECNLSNIKDFSKVPIITSVGRFAEQKGLDYFAKSYVDAVKTIKASNDKNTDSAAQREYPIVAILGSGDPSILEALIKMKEEVTKIDKTAGERILLFDGFSAALGDTLEMGGDLFIMSSKWEPCGIGQLKAMGKGNLPVATATGGLVNTIEDGKTGFLSDMFYGYQTNEVIYDNGKNGGIVKPHNNEEAYAVALDKAFNMFYTNPEKMKEMSIAAMKKDFSWEVPDGALDNYVSLMKTGKLLDKSA